MTRTSVCIIGAGPAGLSASLFLNQAGIDHVLIDRQSFPRDKVCGESFDGKVYHLLNRLNPSWLEELKDLGHVHKCWSYSLTNSWGHKMTVQFPTHHTPKLHIKRKAFDAFLMEKVQASKEAQVWQQRNARKLIHHPDGIQIETDQEDIFAQLLILSNGAHSLLQETTHRPENIFLFARGYFQNIQPIGTSPELEIFFLRQPFKGCLLFCPMANGETNVEIGMEKKEWKRHRQPLEELLKIAIDQDAFRHRFKTARQVSEIKATSMDLFTSPRQYVRERILIAGAAAGSVNPVTGFGVGHAMTMGMLAAQQAKQSLEQKNFTVEFLKSYEKNVRAKLGKEVLLSHTITKLQKKVDLLEPLIFLMSKGHLLSNILKDKKLVDNLFNPSFYWKHCRSAISKKE